MRAIVRRRGQVDARAGHLCADGVRIGKGRGEVDALATAAAIGAGRLDRGGLEAAPLSMVIVVAGTEAGRAADEERRVAGSRVDAHGGRAGSADGWRSSRLDVSDGIDQIPLPAQNR